MTSPQLFEREALPQLPALHQFAYQLCRDDQRSHDLVQETMLKACRYFHTYRKGTNCRAWLFQICKNAYINMYRRRRYEAVPVDYQVDTPDAQENGTWVPVAPCPRDESEIARLAGCFDDEVLAALQGLPQEYHTAVILSDVEGLPYEEIASFTAVPIGTVRSRMHRGRKMLAAALKTYARERGIHAAA